jgi:isoquinoline 1-oxidoreductase
MTPESKWQYRQATELAPESSAYTAPIRWDFAITRRQACQLLAAGTLLTFEALGEELDSAAQRNRLSGRILFGDDNTVTLLTGKVELGQGMRTLLTQAVAEELGLDLHRVRLVTADTDVTPDDGGTWASITTPQTVPVVRRAAATARELLEKANGGQPLGRDAKLAELAAKLDPRQVIEASAALRQPQDWRVLGKSTPSLTALDIVTGKQKYAGDLRRPELKHARMIRPSTYAGKLLSARVTSGKLIREGDFAAVVCSTPQAAENAARAAKVEWEPAKLAGSGELRDLIKRTAKPAQLKNASRYPGLIQQGDARGAIANANRVIRAEYMLPYIAHVPLEPRSSIALFEGGKLTIWTGTQAPFLARQDVAQAVKLPVEKVRIIVQDFGGGYGGKQRGECEAEAARIAMACEGEAVRLAWSRQEEFERSYLRPPALLELAAALDAKGRITAWEHHNYCAGASGLQHPYAFAEYWCGFHQADAPLRHGSYRSLAAVANTFAREMHLDACAKAAEADPVEYRLRHIESARFREVIEKGAVRFGWASRKGGHGMSATIEKGGHLACFVQLEDKPLRVAESLIVADFGAALNPDHLKAQVEGAFIQSLGPALFEEIQWNAESIENSRMSKYRVPRFRDVPAKFEVILVDRRDVDPAGAGEAPITVGAPAIAAAAGRMWGQAVTRLPVAYHSA